MVLQVLPASLVRPSPSRTWQSLFAGSLLLLTLGSCIQLGLAANVHLLPKVGGRGAKRPLAWPAQTSLPWQSNASALSIIIGLVPGAVQGDGP